jgi:hypothetical protein
LSVVPVDTSMLAAIAGSGEGTAILSGRQLTITGSFGGLRAAATLARLYRRPTGVIRGIPVGDLVVSKASSGTVSGAIELTPLQVTDLRNGWLSVQIDSVTAPGGNLLGWILP